jgi:cell division protein ZapA (FtsZ GTPase activity inhibitor)
MVSHERLSPEEFSEVTAEMDNKNLNDPEAASEAVRVNIFDQIYSLRSPKGEEHIRRTARLVDERMRQISAHTTTFELSRIAVLAALNIADELEDLKARREEREMAARQTVNESDGKQAAARPPESPTEEDEPVRQPTWFEAIFDAEVPVKERSERLSSQISNRLQTSRQDNAKESGAADESEG